MPEIRSPLAMNETILGSQNLDNQPADMGYHLSEYEPGFLVQLAGWQDFEDAAKPILKLIDLDDIGDFHRVQKSKKGSCFRIAPEKLLLRVNQNAFESIINNADMVTTPVLDLSQARWIIAIQGQNIEDLMSQLAPLDFSATSFPVGDFRQSGVHQIAVIFHRIEVEKFEIMVPLNWTVCLWELICELTKSAGFEVT